MRRFCAGVRRLLDRAARAVGDESGGAVVEMVFLGVLLFVPLIYLVATLARVQAASYAASAAAREGARLYVTSPTGDLAPQRARAGAKAALENFSARGGLRSVACSASPCLTPEASVTVIAAATVELPLVPDVLGGVVPTSLTVTATHTEQVDRFREVRP